MATQREPTVEEYTAQALKFLEQSDAEFAAGDTRQGAGKLYGAACKIVIAASKQRGWRYNSHRDNKNATVRLAEEYDELFLQAGFITAEMFHYHYLNGGREDYEIAVDRPAARLYVRRMVDLVQAYAADGGR